MTTPTPPPPPTPSPLYVSALRGILARYVTFLQEIEEKIQSIDQTPRIIEPQTPEEAVKAYTELLDQADHAHRLGDRLQQIAQQITQLLDIGKKGCWTVQQMVMPPLNRLITDLAEIEFAYWSLGVLPKVVVSEEVKQLIKETTSNPE